VTHCAPENIFGRTNRPEVGCYLLAKLVDGLQV